MLAYFDGWRTGGLPVRIIAAWRDDNGHWRFKVKATAARYGYERGAVISELSQLSVFPRHALRRRKYGNRIMAYDWNTFAAELTAIGESKR